MFIDVPCGPVGPVGPVGPITPVGPVGPVSPIEPVGPVGPIKGGIKNIAGVDQVRVEGLIELTTACETHKSLPVEVIGVADHPVGGVPTFVTKFQEPPVGVEGAVALWI
jgi:hypothetical protein